MSELPDSLARIVGAGGELAHLAEALTHPSFANEQRSGPRVDYQRLEFLGDAVLQLCISEILVARHPSAGEGELSRRRAAIVGTEALAAYARHHDLGRHLRMGRGADQSGERERDRVLADVLEAVVASVYLDCGLDAARSLARALAEPVIDRGSELLVDAKSELQERVQATGQPAPVYVVTGELGIGAERVFVVQVEVDGGVLGEGRGRSKKLAEQEAARHALDRLCARQRSG